MMFNLLNGGSITDWLISILYATPGILIGLVLHEFAHAFAADRLGDPMPRQTGRLSLNPMAHLDPIGIIMLFVVGFGWAKPVMTSGRYKVKKFGLALVGLAGPLMNLLLTILFVVLYNVLGYTFRTNMPAITMIVVNAMVINAALFLFNLIPLPPLDGYNILKDLVLVKRVDPRKLWEFERYGQFIFIGIIVLTSFLNINVIGSAAFWVVNQLNQLYQLIF